MPRGCRDPCFVARDGLLEQRRNPRLPVRWPCLGRRRGAAPLAPPPAATSHSYQQESARRSRNGRLRASPSATCGIQRPLPVAGFAPLAEVSRGDAESAGRSLPLASWLRHSAACPPGGGIDSPGASRQGRIRDWQRARTRGGPRRVHFGDARSKSLGKRLGRCAADAAGSDRPER